MVERRKSSYILDLIKVVRTTMLWKSLFNVDLLFFQSLMAFQERLMKKLGPHAFPFYFELPPHCPASVTLQPAPGDTGKPCGVDYELKAFVGETQDDKPHKR